MDVPKQVQDKLAQFQNIQNQLQVVAAQKQQLILSSAEVENALTELSKSTEGRIYKAAGSLLIESSREDADKFLKESKETAAARIQILEKQEKKLSEKFSSVKEEIEGMLKRGGGPPSAG